MGGLLEPFRRHHANRILRRAERPIVYYARGGLCNRIKGLVSLQRAARELGLDPFVYWRKARLDISAPYRALFEPSVPILPGKPTIDVEWFGDRAWDLWIGDAVVPEELSAHRHHPPPESGADPGGIDHLFEHTPKHWVDEYVPYFRALRPVPKLQGRIDAMQARLGPSYLGVHMRRGDFLESAQRNVADIPVFADAILRHRRGDQPVFLATDDLDAVTVLETELGFDVVLSSRRSRDREALHASEDAVVDLYTLAGAERLIGTSSSSFGETAWWLSGGTMPAEILGG